MLKRAAKMAFFTIVALGIAAGSAQAVDEPIPGKIGRHQAGLSRSWSPSRSPPAACSRCRLGGDDPTAAGGSVQFFDTNFQIAGDETYNLPAGNWTGLGNPAGSKGFKYKGTKTALDPCNVVLIKEKVIKAICKGSAVTFTPPFNGDLGVILTTRDDALLHAVRRHAVKNQSISSSGRTPRPRAGARSSARARPPATSSTSTSTSSTSTSSTSSTSTSVTEHDQLDEHLEHELDEHDVDQLDHLDAPRAACCGPERITLSSSAGTLAVDNLAPFPFPAGVTTVMDVAAASLPYPDCQHTAIVPAGGFFVPNFDLPALNYCSSVTPIGCDVGTGFGAGNLWDGNGAPGLALINVTKSADTADGVCDTTVITAGTCTGGANNGNPCVQPPDCPRRYLHRRRGLQHAPTGAGGNTLGDIDSVIVGGPGRRRSEPPRHPGAQPHVVGQPLQPGRSPPAAAPARTTTRRTATSSSPSSTSS